MKTVPSPLAVLRDLPFVAWIILYCAVTWGIFGALLGAVTPNLRAQMGVSFQQVGWLMAFWSAGGALGSVFGGSVAKRFAPQKLLLTYSLCVALGLLGVLLAPSFGWLALSMVTIATFETALFTLGHGLLAELSDEPEQRTRIISLVDVGYSLGTVLSPLLVAVVLLMSPWWRGPYVVFGVLVLGMVLLSLQGAKLRGVRFRVHDVAQDPSDLRLGKPPVKRHHPAPGVGSPSAQALGYAGLLRQPLVRWVLLAGVCSGLTEWGQYFWFVSFATEALGLHEQSARLALGFLMAGMVVGRTWQAFVHSRWTLEQKIIRLGTLAALALGALWFSPMGAPFAWLALCNFAAGLGVSVAFPILLGSALRAFPQEAPRLSALLMIAFTAGAQVAALLMGELADNLGLRVAYATLVLAALAFVGCVWQLARLTERLTCRP